MNNAIWELIAYIVSRPSVADWLIRQAQRTPYFHLEGYMERWWVFNPTPAKNNGDGRRFKWLPSIRIHHILRGDHERHQHNHPWDARTIILKGSYLEKRTYCLYNRYAGDTASIKANDFHTIDSVSPGGVWTLFITWRWRHTWGFQTKHGFVPWRMYLEEQSAPVSAASEQGVRS